MSKYQFQESDIYIAGTAIPKNKMGIDDADLLQEIEALLLQQAYQVFINELNDTVCFNEIYFKSLHYRTFVTLYDWAGEYRHVDMRKGGSLFCVAQHLQRSSSRVFEKLEQENFLKNRGVWNTQQFSEKLAFYQSELIALHPFYELNGRITRLFFDLIAIYNGYEPIDYSHALINTDNTVNDYIIASVACVQRADESLLQKIIFTGLKKIDENT